MKNIFLILFILITSFCYSQKCNNVLSGQISDFHDNSTLENATVKLIGTNKITISNKEGKFQFKNICYGTYTIEVSHIACTTEQVSVDVKEDTFTSISLEHHIEELEEVSVKNTVKTETKTAQESVIKADILKRYSSLSLGDALKEVPGISSINTGNTVVKPMINGLHSSRILIMNNGVRQQDQEWGIEHAPNIDINSANKISVIKGSGALAYGGDAIGGVIVINPSKAISKDTLYGTTTIGGQTNGRGYNVTSKLNKNYNSGWFAQIQASYKRNGDFKAPDYNLTNTGVNSKGISARFGKKKFESGFELFYSFLDNEIAILRAAHIGNAFDLRRAINFGEPFVIDDFSYDIDVPRQDIKHHLAKANYYKRFQNFGKVSLQYDYQNNQRLEFDVRIGDRRNIPAVDLTLQTQTVLADVNLDSNLDRKINFGIMGRFQDNFASPDTGVRRLIPDYVKYDVGAYITTEWKLNDNLLVDAGLRYDFNNIDAKKYYRNSTWEERGYDEDFSDIIIEQLATQLLANPVFNYHNISVAIGGKYTINEHNQILLNYSLASRPPNPSELFSDGLHHSSARIEIGDIRFDKEIANRVSASYTYTNNKFNLLAEAFYNKVNNYIYLKPIGDEFSNRGAFPVWLYEQTNAKLFGIDINASYNISPRFNLQNKSAFIKGYDLKANLPLIDIPSFSTENKITYNNKQWHNFSASITSDWVFKQNEFPNFNYIVFDELNEIELEVNISTPPPAYHLLHLYSDITFYLSKKTNLNVSLAVNNICNTSYRNYLNRLRFYADDLGRNITLQLQLNY